MADSTQSSIEIAASPGEVLDVVADFEQYPTWAKQVTSCTVVSEDGDGWADRVRFVLDAGAIKDRYVLEYDWDIDEDGVGSVSWSLVESDAKAMNGTYTLAPSDDRHVGHLRPRRRREDPDDRDAQAQGGEDDRGHRAQRA